jgi:DNA-binding transcriptional ArsR family regulator
MMPQNIAYAHERQVVGTLLLNLLFAIFEHNDTHLKRHFGASLETMVIGIAVVLGQLASHPASVSRLAQLLGVPRRTVTNKLRELAAAGAVVKKGSHYVANYEIFASSDPETAAHITRMKEAILGACKKLDHSGGEVDEPRN